MKFIIQSEDAEVIKIVDGCDLDSTEVLRNLVNIMVAYGYHPDSVNESICELAEEIEDEFFND